MRRFSLSRQKRLSTNGQFKAVFARNMRASNGLLRVYMAENDRGYSRLGVSIGKSCGNAVLRNRLKRLLREAFRQNQDKLPSGFDYVLMISPVMAAKLRRRETAGKIRGQITFERFESSLLTLAKQAMERKSSSFGAQAEATEPGPRPADGTHNKRAAQQ